MLTKMTKWDNLYCEALVPNMADLLEQKLISSSVLENQYIKLLNQQK